MFASRDDGCGRSYNLPLTAFPYKNVAFVNPSIQTQEDCFATPYENDSMVVSVPYYAGERFQPKSCS